MQNKEPFYLNDIVPKVSVVVCTYEHVKFIEKCLEGILMQKTDFPFEVIIGEDESIDGTREICIKYAEQYPEIIRLFLRFRKDVVYIKGRPTGRYNLLESLKSANSKYIAYCDGDDYWCDVNKLQKQFDFLSENKDYTFIGYNSFILNNFVETSQLVKQTKNNRNEIFTSDLIERNPFIHSTSMYAIPEISNHISRLIDAISADWEIATLCSTEGRCMFINEPAGYYRLHKESATFNDRVKYPSIKREFLNRIAHAEYWNAITGYKYNEIAQGVKNRRGRFLMNKAIKNFKLKDAIKFSQIVDGDLKFNSKISSATFLLLKFLYRIIHGYNKQIVE